MVMSPETKRILARTTLPFENHGSLVPHAGARNRKSVLSIWNWEEDSFLFSPGDAIGIICPNARSRGVHADENEYNERG